MECLKRERNVVFKTKLPKHGDVIVKAPLYEPKDQKRIFEERRNS